MRSTKRNSEQTSYPPRMSREELRDGYVQLMRELYEPAAYFDRLDDLFMRGNFRFSQTRAAYWRRHPWSWLKGNATDLARSAVIYRQLMRGVPEATLRREYRRRILGLLRSRRDPVVLFVYLLKCVIHYHLDNMVENMDVVPAPDGEYVLTLPPLLSCEQTAVFGRVPSNSSIRTRDGRRSDGNDTAIGLDIGP